MAEPRQRYSYPGYDVLAKRDTPSWNAQTRAVVEERLAPPAPGFFDAVEWRVLVALCARILPQPALRDRPVPLPEMIDAQMRSGHGDGYRIDGMPPIGECWRQGLRALDAEARLVYGAAFPELTPGRQDALLGAVQRGETRAPEWRGLPPKAFFKSRVLHDIGSAYYAHPTAWSEIGFGGPASPRGYVRMDENRRDPWEAAEHRHDR